MLLVLFQPVDRLFTIFDRAGFDPTRHRLGNTGLEMPEIVKSNEAPHPDFLRRIRKPSYGQCAPELTVCRKIAP